MLLLAQFEVEFTSDEPLGLRLTIWFIKPSRRIKNPTRNNEKVALQVDLFFVCEIDFTPAAIHQQATTNCTTDSQ